MKLLLATTFFLLSIPCGAAPNAPDYPLTAHVSASRFKDGCNTGQIPCLGPQLITATIEETKYELSPADSKTSRDSRKGLLAIGDYKARILRDDHKNSYQVIRVYEFLFPDNSTKRFEVVGMSQ